MTSDRAVQWSSEKYGGWRADLGRGLILVVSYEGIERLPADAPKYNVYVFGLRLKARSASQEEAMKRAETVALRWIEDIHTKLAPAHA